MKVPFYRSLDREINIFGLRGGWVRNFLFIAGGSLVLALLVGAVTSTGMGFVIFLVGLIGGFFLCLVLQQRAPSRQLDKLKVESRMKGYIIRRETLTHIVPRDIELGK